MLAIPIAGIVNAVLSNHHITLLPDRTNDELSFGLATGGAALIMTMIWTIRVRSKLKRNLLASVSVLGLFALLLGFMLGLFVSADVFALTDFGPHPMREFDGFLRVSRFHISHGRGASYDLDLSDFSPSLSLYWDDYKRGTGGRDEVAITDGCIRVHLQRSGRALRMIQPERVLVVHCPSKSGIVEPY